MKHDILRSTPLVCLLALSFVFACGGGAAKPVPLRTPSVAAPDDDADLARAAIIRAFEARKYTILVEEDNSIIGRWHKGSAYLVAEMVYNNGEVEIRYVESEQGPAPEGMVPRRYARYMNNLAVSVKKELAQPGRNASRDAKREARLEKKRKAEEARRKRMVLISDDIDPKEVRKQIILELQARRYTIESEKGKVIRARWAKGDLWYSVKISYSTTKVKLVYIDGHEHDEDEGIKLIDDRYVSYLDRLSSSISKRLN